MTSGTPPDAYSTDVGCPTGPLGSTSTIRGVSLLTRFQSSTPMRLRPAACAMAGVCSSRFVEPPHAACTTMAFSKAASVRMSCDVTPRFSDMTSAFAERRAMSSHAPVPEGDSAPCVIASPSASATTWDVPAVPRNWHPPPGEAQARQPMSWAYSSVTSPWANRAPIDWIMPVSSPCSGARVTPPGTITTGMSRSPASAIIIAGRPLSHDATPITPRDVGSDLASLLNTCAASFRYGSESSIPVVPCVRPSHGSEQNSANGIDFCSRSSNAAARTIVASSKWPV